MKRIRGRGRIEKKADGKYRLRVSMGYSPDGRKLEKSKTVYVEGKNEKDKQAKAEREMRAFIYELEEDIGLGADMKFSVFYNKWKEDYAKQHLEKNTQHWYSSCAPLILEYFGKRKLGAITVKNVEDFMKWVVDNKDKSRSYSNRLYKILKAMMKAAVRWQMIAKNPCENVRLYSINKDDISVYNSDMINQMIKTLEDYPIKQKLYVLLPLFCGLRREEVAALRWCNIDLDKQKLYVREAAVYAGKEFGAYVKTPKTKSSVREVDMPSFLVAAMKEYRKGLQAKRLAMGAKLEPKDFVLMNEESGNMMLPDSLSSWFAKFIKRHSLPRITYHGLRHTYASLLIRYNIDVARVSENLGHSDVTTTLKFYTHGIKEAEREVANVLDEKFGSTIEIRDCLPTPLFVHAKP